MQNWGRRECGDVLANGETNPTVVNGEGGGMNGDVDGSGNDVRRWAKMIGVC